MVEYVILKLLEVDTVLQMLDTLFIDMTGDHEIFDEVRQKELRLFIEKKKCDGVHHHHQESKGSA